MTFLLENTLQIALLGALLITLLGAFWWHTGQRLLLLATLGMIVLTAGALLVERLVETDRESAIRTVHEICASIGHKPLEQLLEYVHPSAVEIRDAARAEFSRYELDAARVTQIWDVAVDPTASPPQAVVRCNISVTGGVPASGISRQVIVRYVVVTLARDQQRWKVLTYEHAPPQNALQRR
jgi:hypothetical protein